MLPIMGSIIIFHIKWSCLGSNQKLTVYETVVITFSLQDQMFSRQTAALPTALRAQMYIENYRNRLIFHYNVTGYRSNSSFCIDIHICLHVCVIYFLPGMKAIMIAIISTSAIGIQVGARTHHQLQSITLQSFSTMKATWSSVRNPVPPAAAVLLLEDFSRMIITPSSFSSWFSVPQYLYEFQRFGLPVHPVL